MSNTQCIILAAGYSSRAKTNKMLLPLGNKTVIERCIDSFVASCSQTFVVGGHRMEELKQVLMKYNHLQFIYNSHYSDGMFGSVKEGLKYITGDRVLITPGDYPMLQQTTIEKMLEREEPVIIPMYNGISGHPVLMKSHLIPEIINGSFESLREFVNAQNPLYLEVKDIGVITDLDTMEDYDRILEFVT